jgi:serine protease AprX
MRPSSFIVYISILILILSCITTTQSSITNDPNNTANRLNLDDNVPILIHYNKPPTDQDVQELEQLGIEVVYRCKYIDVIECGVVESTKFDLILGLPGISFIEPTPDLKPLLDVSTRAVKARESQEYSPDTAWELDYFGKGINIAIMDTGVDDGHPSLSGKFVAGADFAGAAGRVTPKDGSYNPDDDTGHGTALAGVAMGTGGAEEIYKGVAPDAKLIDVRVSIGRGGNFLQAIEWCIDNRRTDWNSNGPDEHDGIDVISLSMGGEENSDGSGAVCQLLNQASDAGIVVVVAIGNEGPNNQGIGNIAAADKAITVGNLDDRGTVIRDDDDVHSSSTRGPRSDDGDEDLLEELKPDVIAPGTNIMAPDFRVVGQRVQGYEQYTGSSYSCPHVAGIAALMLEANPELRPREIKKILQDTAEAMGEPSVPELSDKYNYVAGFGSADAYEAVREAKSFETSNNRPEIKSVSAQPKFVAPNEESTITTTASDADGDLLSYNYTATGGTFTGTGSEVTWTAPDEVGEYEITAIVDDGYLLSEPESVTVTVETDPSNHAPEIHDVKVSTRVVEPGQNATITVTASDPDDDKLFYEYNANGGTIIGDGAVVNWIAPNNDGKYTISISVSDGSLTSETEKVIITVEGSGENKPPEIVSFSASVFLVQTNGNIKLTVTAIDPENAILDYSYSANAGRIVGKGANVTWTAPDTAGSVIIRATVTDPGGANPSSVKSDGKSEILFTVRVTDENGLDDISKVTIDLSSIFGSENQKLYDNGKQGDRTQNDGIYSVSYILPKGVSGGEKQLPVQVEDDFNEIDNDHISITVTAVSDKSDDSGLLGSDLNIPGFDGGILLIGMLVLVLLIAINRKRK